MAIEILNPKNKVIFVVPFLIVIFAMFFFVLRNLYSQEDIQMTIKAQYFKLIEKTYYDMEKHGIDLSEYEISIRIENNTLHVLYNKPHSSWIRGSPLESPSFVYEIDIALGEIIKIQGIR